jgi:hypothetical protein
MAISPTALEQPRLVLVIRVVAIGALVLVIVLTLVASHERQPHVELAPPPVSLAMPPIPMASGAIVPPY